MAIIKGKAVSGLVGNTVYRNLSGIQVAQSRPEFTKKSQTIGTKEAAAIFGQASHLSQVIRHAMHDIVCKLCDGAMHARLTGELQRCLSLTKINQPPPIKPASQRIFIGKGLNADKTQKNNANKTKRMEPLRFQFNADSFGSLTGFEFNIKSPLKKLLFIRPHIRLEGMRLWVDIPEFSLPGDLRFPETGIDARLVISTAIIDLHDKEASSEDPQFMDIPNSHKVTSLPGKSFSFDLKPGCLCITGITIEYLEETFSGQRLINNKMFHPAAILHTIVTDAAGPDFRERPAR